MGGAPPSVPKGSAFTGSAVARPRPAALNRPDSCLAKEEVAGLEAVAGEGPAWLPDDGEAAGEMGGMR